MNILVGETRMKAADLLNNEAVGLTTPMFLFNKAIFLLSSYLPAAI
jgi:hypothetical protein